MVTTPTIFLVDDDQAARKALTAALEQRGLSVASYDSARAFLEAYVDEPGCLILDLCMPMMSGIELQQVLVEKQIGIPIIFITGHGDVPTAVQALKAGAIDFLEKPYSQESLSGRITEALAEDARKRQEKARKDRVVARFQGLTQREREVMELMVAGPATATNKQIAIQLHISHRTVDDHRAHMMMKMQARSISHLVELAKICGIYKYDETV